MINELVSRMNTTAKISIAAKGRAGDLLDPRQLLPYVDTRCKAIFNGPDNNHGLKFVSVEICDHQETVRRLSRQSDKTYDITRSTMYLWKLTFKYPGGKHEERYTYMPYVKDSHNMIISGTSYTIVDVISDKCISPGLSGVFIRFLKNKINIPWIRYSILAGGVIKEAMVPHSEPLSSRSGKTPPKTPILWYLLVHYGLDEAIRRIHGCKIKVMSRKDVGNYRNNPKWVVYNTVHFHRNVSTSKDSKGRTRSTGRDVNSSSHTLRYKYMNGKVTEMEQPDLVIVVPKEDATLLMEQTIASIFYVVDIIPVLNYESIYDRDTLHYALALIVFHVPDTKLDQNTMRKRLRDKLSTLDGHVDSYMQQILKSEFGDTLDQDFTVDGFYKVLIAVYKRYKVWRESARWIVANVLDKKFEIRDYLTVPLFHRLNTLNFNLSQMATNRGRRPDANTIKNHVTRDITMAIMFAIRNDTLSCTRISYGGDNRYHKNTSTLHLQFNVPSSTGNKNSRKGGRGKRTDPVVLIHETHPFCGTSMGVSKSRDTVLKYLNMFAPLDPYSNTIVPSKAMLERSKPLEEILRNMSTRSRDIEVPKEFSVVHTPVDYSS